jgi:hypothetical protein
MRPIVNDIREPNLTSEIASTHLVRFCACQRVSMVAIRSSSRIRPLPTIGFESLTILLYTKAVLHMRRSR